LCDAERLQALLQRLDLPTALPAGLAPDQLLARMRLDKKADAGGIRLVLWDGAGRARLVAGVDDDAILEVLEVPTKQM
jgi:3-dehydroquinate synthase